MRRGHSVPQQEAPGDFRHPGPAASASPRDKPETTTVIIYESWGALSRARDHWRTRHRVRYSRAYCVRRGMVLKYGWRGA
jgi:hypothetical protein